VRIFIPQRAESRFWTFCKVIIVINYIFLLILGPGCSTRTSSDRPLPPEGFQAQLDIKNKPAALKAYKVFKAEIVIKNNSPVTWASRGGKERYWNWIRLSYRWYDLSGKPVSTPMELTNLPHDLEPQQQVEVVAKVVLPERQGEYLLEFDMLQEGVEWFKSEKSPALIFKVKVEEN
jgi:hypothetical protein